MKNDIVKFIPIGGQAEMGKSMYCIEINEKIFIIDSGFRFPDSDKLGVDIIIPSFTYLEEKLEYLSFDTDNEYIKMKYSIGEYKIDCSINAESITLICKD